MTERVRGREREREGQWRKYGRERRAEEKEIEKGKYKR
jgi:hypothetical protein